MDTNLEFASVKEVNGLSGFGNLLAKENNRWWGTRRWLANLILWLLLLSGSTACMLFIVPQLAEKADPGAVQEYGGIVPFGYTLGITIFFDMGTLILAIGAIILGQGLLLDERLDGTIEWLLSKPITRQSYVLAKLIAATLIVLVLFIAVPALLTDGLFSLHTGELLPQGLFWGAVSIQTLHTLFYLTFTLFLGSIFNNRSILLGIAFGMLMGGQFIGGIIKSLTYIMPWPLAKMGSLIMNNQQLPLPLSYTAVGATALWCTLFVLGAIWNLQKHEY